MSWTEIRATAAQAGQKFVVAQPAFVLGLFGDIGLNAYGEAVLDWWMELLPKGAPLFFLSSTAHNFREVNPRVLKRIHATLRDLGKKSQFYMFKDAPEFAVGTHSLELAMGIEPEDDEAVNLAYAALPQSYPDEAGPDAAVEMFHKLVDEIPFRHATAGYGFDLVWGREWEQVAMPVIMAAGRRFLSLDVRERQAEQYLVDKLKSAAWLTFLHNDLLAKLGGPDRMNQVLTDRVGRVPSVRGMILRAGERPPVGDTNRHAPDLGPLREVNRFIEPIREESWVSTRLFRISPADANAWFSRLDE